MNIEQKMLNRANITKTRTLPMADRIEALEAEVAQLKSYVNALGKTELQGEGTAEKPFTLTVGMELVPNAYYTSNGIRYVYMGTATNYNGEELTFDNGWAEF